MLSEDHDIIIALQRGDEKVFEEIFRRHYQSLCRYGSGILNDGDEAEECVQNVFLKIWEKRSNLEITTSIKSYLYRAVHNACINHIRKGKVRSMYADDHIATHSPVYEHSAQTVIASELEKEINTAIAELPEQCRMVFKLSRYEQLKYAEIAELLEISVKTVENHMGKALKILRERLKDYLVIIIILFPWLF